IARALGIRTVVVPALAAVLSAFGAATAEVRHEAVRALLAPLPLDAATLGARFAELADEVRAAMAASGIPAERVVVEREVDLRFRRQTWEVTVPLPTLDADAVRGLEAAFRARYAALYGTGALVHGTGVELVNCRAIAICARADESTSAPPPPAHEAVPRGSRFACLPGTDAAVRVPVYDGEGVAAGATLAGPALVERADTTVLLAAGDRARVAGSGDLVLEVGHA
ncbi:MAG TPA: hypothetical protein VKA21_08815, partial [Candidatus Binatia bacterium]|nr:hypothetical protein [Candidatus Binatia bacterium]